MVRSLTAGMLAETQAGVTMPAIFVEVQNAGATHYLWSGLGSIAWNAHTWLGAGKLLSFSSISESIKTEASGVTIALNGLDTALVASALADLRRSKPVRIWIGALDASLAVIADPYQIFPGRMDAAECAADGESAGITIMAENRFLTLNRPRERRYTDQDQRRERPYDGGFKFVDALQDTKINWNGMKASMAQLRDAASYTGPGIIRQLSSIGG